MSSDFGIYIHTPWCKSRCPYCAFNVYLSHSADYTRWHDCIIAAWSTMQDRFDGNAHSLYFGGGTPSLAPPAIIQRIIDALPLHPQAEVTLEANPGTISADGLNDMRTAGINRLSIGVQTFNKEHARALGRGHTIDQARSLLQSADALGFDSWSTDLMFSLPDQTENELNADLDALLDIGPPHVSIYGLSIEPGTPFHDAYRDGKLPMPEAETWRRMYDTIVHRMQASGLHRYEVSNFARRDHRAVHNEQVWRGGHYAGLGPGAHGFLPSGHRTLGNTKIDAWYANPVPTEVLPDRHDAAVDYLLSSLRHVGGASRSLLRERYQFDFGSKDIHQLSMKQFIYEEAGHVRLTPSGFPLADGILHKLVDGIECIKPT